MTAAILVRVLRMRVLSAILFTMACAGTASGSEIESEYTDLDAEKDCAVYDAADAQAGGDWSKMVCPGWRGYPVLLDYSDLRESIFYGFPPQDEEARPWESFSGFNRSGPKIEWRILLNGDRKVPIATIHRWFVAGEEDPEEEIEVLVVEKVGLPGERSGCVMGYVVATANDAANEKARRIADDQYVDFACGADQPVIDAGAVPVPLFTGAEGE